MPSPASGAASATDGSGSCSREGMVMNHKELYRLYREEGLAVRRRRGRKRATGTRAPAALPQAPNQRWSLDFVSDCLVAVGDWLRSSLSGFNVRVLQDPDQIKGTLGVDEQVRAVIINAGPERMLSPTVARLLLRVGELLPEVPVAVLSDFEDAGSIRKAFIHGVRGYIPTSLASLVAVEAVRMVCVGGTFAPAAALLSQSERTGLGGICKLRPR